MLLTYNVVIII